MENVSIDFNEDFVNMQFTINGFPYEIEGTVIPFSSGRGIDYKFEPNYFSDDDTEIYYSENWEVIEKLILEKWKY